MGVCDVFLDFVKVKKIFFHLGLIDVKYGKQWSWWVGENRLHVIICLSDQVICSFSHDSYWYMMSILGSIFSMFSDFHLINKRKIFDVISLNIDLIVTDCNFRDQLLDELVWQMGKNLDWFGKSFQRMWSGDFRLIIEQIDQTMKRYTSHIHIF